ncbi:hypothetical protein [Kitasatospora sp. NPDC094015]|uniref:HAAS signaling domain-containing protein n=1 Tax=Kitasatospora sp. NPDC094015 TaxID=3155205 RepID=UPI003320E82D
MNDTLTHPLVRAFLSAVEQRVVALPEQQRRELLADLSEHIEVSLAEAGTDPSGSEEDAVRRVLGLLGAPADIAAAALAEEPGDGAPVPASGGHTALTLALAVAPLPVLLVPGVGPVLALAAMVTALVRLWRSAQWTRPEKRRATLLLLSPLLTVPLLVLLGAVATGGLSAAAILAVVALALGLPVVATVLLGRSAARLRRAHAL